MPFAAPDATKVATEYFETEAKMETGIGKTSSWEAKTETSIKFHIFRFPNIEIELSRRNKRKKEKKLFYARNEDYSTVRNTSKKHKYSKSRTRKKREIALNYWRGEMLKILEESADTQKFNSIHENTTGAQNTEE